jgi:uncharacterized protein (TIGR02246 family)
MTDLEAIEALRRRDVEASLAQDPDKLAALWTDDPIGLSPFGPPTRGKAQMRAQLEALVAHAAKVEVTEYREDFDELQICGDYAWEWGVIRGAERNRTSGDVSRSAFRVMRILKRVAPGDWRVHRSIFFPLPG